MTAFYSHMTIKSPVLSCDLWSHDRQMGSKIMWLFPQSHDFFRPPRFQVWHWVMWFFPQSHDYSCHMTFKCLSLPCDCGKSHVILSSHAHFSIFYVMWLWEMSHDFYPFWLVMWLFPWPYDSHAFSSHVISLIITWFSTIFSYYFIVTWFLYFICLSRDFSQNHMITIRFFVMWHFLCSHVSSVMWC